MTNWNRYNKTKAQSTFTDIGSFRLLFLKYALPVLLASASLFGLSSCAKDEEMPDSPGNESVETEETEPFTIDAMELKPTGEVDPDVDEIDGIAITSVLELTRIGKTAEYPMDGDYVLAADLDCSGIQNFSPIGGAFSDCGIVSGENVFTGTFDGRGHTIMNMNILLSSYERVHVGMFGSVGSDDENDPAVIKNIIFKDVTVTGKADGPATYAILAGQVDGYAIIDNISLISGEVNIDVGSGDILGIGSLIGQCRTQSWTGCSNMGVSVTNIYSNISVYGTNNSSTNYTSGIIGRIRGSNLGELSNVLFTGVATFSTYLSNPISSGDSKAEKIENVYYLEGSGEDLNGFGHIVKTDALTSGEVTLDSDYWVVESGFMPLLKMTKDSSLFSILDFVTVELKDGESEDKIKSDFSVTDEFMGEKIEWVSSDESVIKIVDGTAKVIKPSLGFKDVTLYATNGGYAKKYNLRVVSGVVGSLVREGNDIVAKNFPNGVEYKWVVKNPVTDVEILSRTTDENKITLTENMQNAIIKLSVEGYDDLTFFNSNLPTIYISSDRDYYSVEKDVYSPAQMSISTTEFYSDTKYNGDIQIKLRGNSTAYQSKRPFHIKLSKKTDMFGMGEDKHWVLLANTFDRTNMRNKLSYDFGANLGLLGCESILVNLIYNGHYYGIYQFCENIRIDPERVDIFNWEDVAEDVAKAIGEKENLSDEDIDKLEDNLTANLSWVTSGKFGNYTISNYYDTSNFDITGGYLLENDSYYDEYSKFTTENDMKIMVQSPEYLATNTEMFSFLIEYIQDMEDSIYSPNRLNDEGKHYSEYMDVDSFIDFWMVNQVFKNVELLFKSCYMYKDVGGLLTFGPIWDMDWAAGNHVNLWGDSGRYDSWWHSESQDREYWYRALYNDPDFIVKLYDRWNEIQGEIDKIFTELDSIDSEIGSVADLDNKLWNYEWSNSKEVSNLREWLENRREWMNTQFSNPQKLMKSFGYYEASKNFSIDKVEEDDSTVKLTISVKDDVLVSVDILVNGSLLREEPITNGCVISIDKSELREAGKYNAIELLAKKEDGSYRNVKKRSGLKGSTMVEASTEFYMVKE